MRLFFIFAVLLSVAFLTAGAQAGENQAYLSVLPTIPVMEGTREISESAILFDKPEGRIAQTFIYSEQADVPEILNFYTITLPQLGWKTVSKNTYVREGEKLSFLSLEDETADSRGTTLKVLLGPIQKN